MFLPRFLRSVRRRKRATTFYRQRLADWGPPTIRRKSSRLVTELHMQRTILDRISARIQATSPRAAARYPKRALDETD